MTEEDDRSAWLAAAKQQIYTNPGYQEFLDIQALGQTISAIFRPNRQTLLDLLDRAAKDLDLAIELIQNVREPHVRDAFHADLARALHNYVAASMTLVEHTRRLLRGRTDAFLDEFERRKAAAVSHGEVQFVQGLRNFMLHRTLPVVGHRLTFNQMNTPQQDFVSEVHLSVSHLLEGDWTAPVRTFLRQQGPDLELRRVVHLHGMVVDGLNAWLYDALTEANAPKLNELNRLVHEVNGVLLGTDANSAREMLAERRQALPRQMPPG